jgi:hypothetical protein
MLHHDRVEWFHGGALESTALGGEHFFRAISSILHGSRRLCMRPYACDDTGDTSSIDYLETSSTQDGKGILLNDKGVSDTEGDQQYPL